MDEIKLDEMIRQALGELTEPPAAPLDTMWAHVEREHFGPAATRAGTHVATATATIPETRPGRIPFASRWGTTLLVAAAALLIGVGVGRISVRLNETASRAAVTGPRMANAADASRKANSTVPIPQAAPPSVVASRASRASDATSIEHATPPDRTPTQYSAPPAAAARLASRDRTDTYGDEMGGYLARTASLLATLPANGHSGESDAGVADRAGALLTQTHLLLDSRTGSDPTLHKLLEDLELVLAQVARLHPARGTTDLQLIREAMQQRDVLPRLHDAAVEAQSTD